MRHEHPLRIVLYSARNIWLLLIPLLRRLGEDFPEMEGILQILRSIVPELCLLMGILLLGWLRWYCRRYTLQADTLILQEGVVLRRSSRIPLRAVTSVSAEIPLYCRPFGAVRLHLRSAGRDPGIDLLLHEKDAAALCRLLPPLQENADGYRVHFWRVLFFAILCASSLSGALYTAAFWVEGGAVARELLTQLPLREQLSAVSEELAARVEGLSPSAVMAGAVVLLAWGLSLLRNLLRYCGFCMETDGEVLVLRSGIFSKRKHILRIGCISALEMRRNLLMGMLRHDALLVHSPGYHSRKDVPVCLPLLRRRELQKLPSCFDLRAAQKPMQWKPPLTAWWGYLWAPVTGMAAVFTGSIVCRAAMPGLSQLWIFLQWMLLLPLFWKLFVQIAALLTSGIRLDGDRICLRTAKGFVFQTILVPAGGIALMELTANPWQRMFGKCHLRILLQTPVHRSFLLRNMDAGAMRQLAKHICHAQKKHTG